MSDLSLEDWATFGLVALVYSAYLAAGSTAPTTALIFTALQSLLLSFILLTRWGRLALERLIGIEPVAILFALVIIAALVSLLPIGALRNPLFKALNLEGGVSVSPSGTLIQIARLLGLGALFLSTALIAVSRTRRNVLVKLLIGGAFLFDLACLVVEALSPTDVFGWTKPTIAYGRVSGLFSSPNTAATVFGLNAILAAGRIFRRPSTKGRNPAAEGLQLRVLNAPLSSATLVLSVGCLLLSGSRGAALAMAATFLIAVLLLAIRRPRIKARSIALAICGVGLLLLCSGSLVVGRLLSVKIDSDWRPLWDIFAWKIFLTSPWMGYGLGSFQTVLKHSLSPQNFTWLSWAGAVHNVYLQWLMEAGLAGAAPMAALVVAILVAKSRNPRQGAIRSLSLVLAVIFVGLHSVVEYSLQEPSIACFVTVLLGLYFGITRPSQTLSSIQSGSHETRHRNKGAIME